MMNKKKLLFVIDSLGVGGAEKSLITLLNLLDYSYYEVDLQLFAYGRDFEQFLPREVYVLPPFRYTNFLKSPIGKQILKPRMFWARIRYSIFIRKKGLCQADKACLYWQTIGKCIENSTR